ncbi:hypothetical protein HAX54_015217, partial [Datura stramonium]|nr:hypothetical protein [Datura stramonium]
DNFISPCAIDEIPLVLHLSKRNQQAFLLRRLLPFPIQIYHHPWWLEKKEKYALENWIDESRLALEFPTIQDKLYKLGVGYIFAEPKECKLTLVREFCAKWDTSFGEITKVNIQGQVVRFTYKRFHVQFFPCHT